MKESPVRVSLSSIDEERFGVRTARALQVTTNSLEEVQNFCRDNNVKFLIARCSASELAAAQAMEGNGFILMDTLVYYRRNLVKTSIPADENSILVRPVRAGDEEAVEVVAAGSFAGYFGHYHADPRLDRAKCDEAYISWAVRSCISREVADEVLVADEADTILGFATLHINSPQEGEGVLFGVAPIAQGRGIYRSFMIHSMNWFASKGCTSMVVSTQITNIAVQKVWTRVGFEPSHAYYTFHKWFE